MTLERSGGKREGYCSVNTASQQHRCQSLDANQGVEQRHCLSPSSALAASCPQVLWSE